jgi:hypothetical protein
MKRALMTIVVASAFCVQAQAIDTKTITEKPTADNPRYDNKQTWPMLVGDEYFTKEKWDTARVLIWAHPGVTPRRGDSQLDPKNPDNWIDVATGRAADTIPDMDTDVIIPDSDTPYRLAMGMKDFACRHLTVGNNAHFSVEGGGNFMIFGNLWIREQGIVTSWRNTTFAGSADTFLRYDWPADGVLKKMHDERLVTPFDPQAKETDNPWMGYGRKTRSVATYLVHDKAPDKSTEVIGYVRITDEVGIKSGALIIGRDSRFNTTGPSTVSVSRGAKVILMDGALCSHGMNQFPCRDWGVNGGGQVTGGAPDRPLKRDAYMGMGYKNWINLPIPQREGETKPIPTTAGGAKMYYGYGSYSTIVDGDLIGYPANGSDARLVVCWQRISAGGAGCWGRADEAFKNEFHKIPPKIQLWISGESKVENVRFDDLQPGGIVTKSLETFESWKNVSFGDGCLRSETKDLVRGYEAELAEMGGGHPTSTLEPKNQYTTLPKT